jgi:hypothetical protein
LHRCIFRWPIYLEQRSLLPEAKPQVFEDSLSDNDLKSLLTIIGDPDMRELSGIDKSSTVIGSRERREVVLALITRGETNQTLICNSQSGSPEHHSKALPKPLGALVGWSDTTAKTPQSPQVRPLTNTKPVSCWLAN